MDGTPIIRTFKLTDLVWLAWLGAAGWVTWPALWWELDYLRRTCPNYFAPFLVVLAISPLLLMAWREARGRFLRRHEFTVVAVAMLALCLDYEPQAAVVTMLVLCSCCCAGRTVTRALGMATGGPVEDVAISAALGLGLIHCVLFLLGLAGGYAWPEFAILLAIPLVLWRGELRVLFNDVRQMDAAWDEAAEAHSWAGALLSASLLLFVFAAVAYSLLPSTYFDMVNTHLPAARYYAARQALVAPGWLPYAYYPQSVETLMTVGYALAGRPAAQLLPGIYFAMSMLLLVRIGRLSGASRFASLAGEVFALSIPMLHWTGGSGKNDFALAMFLWALCWHSCAAGRPGSGAGFQPESFCWQWARASSTLCCLQPLRCWPCTFTRRGDNRSARGRSRKWRACCWCSACSGMCVRG